ncbi:MAG: inositol monophosphatase [Candidatus Magasanikbacteria bacterium]
MNTFLKIIIKEAGDLAKEYFEKGVEHTTKSSPADFVTEADTAVSDFLIERIRSKYPDHNIKSEEQDESTNPGAEYEWVIDPIDGTRNFTMGVPVWCVIIAVLKDGVTQLGAVYNPNSDDLFFAEKEKGAFRNGKQIHVNNADRIDYAFANVARAYEGGVYGDYIDRYRRVNVRLVLETKAWLHNYGCMLPACYLASGAVDFMLGNAGMDWDYLAPFLICEEAGAVITDSDGNPWKRGRQDMVIANKDLHPKVMGLLRPQ